MPSRATCTPTAPRRRSCTGTWARNRFKDVTAETGLGDAGWSGDASVADLNGDGFPDLFALNMQGSNHYFENQGGKRFVDKTRAALPADVVGRDGHQVLRLRQRRTARPVHHRHAFRHERGGGTGPRKAQVADGVDQGLPAGRRDQVRLRQLVLPQSRERPVRGGLRPAERRRTTGRGDRASAT